jgi:hypothetical protein
MTAISRLEAYHLTRMTHLYCIAEMTQDSALAALREEFLTSKFWPLSIFGVAGQAKVRVRSTPRLLRRCETLCHQTKVSTLVAAASRHVFEVG